MRPYRRRNLFGIRWKAAQVVPPLRRLRPDALARFLVPLVFLPRRLHHRNTLQPGPLGGVVLFAGGLAGLFTLSGWMAAVAAGLGMGAGVGGVLIATQYRTLSETGVRERAEVQAYLDRERTAVESTLDANPVAAAHRFVEALPWLTLDTSVDSTYVKAINDALEKRPNAVTLPPWIEDRVGKGESKEVFTTFLPLYIVMMSSTSVSASGSGSSASSVSVGAGATGGVGGGGGGVS